MTAEHLLYHQLDKKLRAGLTASTNSAVERYQTRLRGEVAILPDNTEVMILNKG